MAINIPPRGGRVEIKRENDFPTFKDSLRAHCSNRRVPGVAIYYKANPGFSGQDSFTVDVYWVDGDRWTENYTVMVQ